MGAALVWMGAVFSLAIVVALLLLVVLGVWVVLSASGKGFGTVRRGARRARREGGFGVCGACGHAVGVRITGERCGECGTAYLRGGIVTTATTVRLGAPLSLAVVVVLAVGLSIGAVTVSIGMTLGNRVVLGGGQISRLTGNQSYGPRFSPGAGSGPRDYDFYVDYKIVGATRQAGGFGSIEPYVEPRRGTLTLGLRGQSVTPISLDYDISDREWSIPTRGQLAGASGSDAESAVRELFKRGAPAGPSTLVADELKDAMLIASTMAGEGATASGVPSIHTEITQDNVGLWGRGGGWGTMPVGPTWIGGPATIVGAGLGLVPPVAVLVVAIWLLVRARRRALSVARPGS